MFTWLALALVGTANLRLFIFSIIYFFKQRQILTPQPQQTPQTLPSIQIPNSTIAEYPNQIPQHIQQQLQGMISQRQLVNVNHNQLALRYLDYFLSQREIL
jgi:hypothetical protein